MNDNHKDHFDIGENIRREQWIAAFGKLMGTMSADSLSGLFEMMTCGELDGIGHYMEKSIPPEERAAIRKEFSRLIEQEEWSVEIARRVREGDV